MQAELINTQHEPTDQWWNMAAQVRLEDRILDMVGCDGMPVLMPKEWASETNAKAFFDAATTILSRLPQGVESTPWIIGSMSNDIMGNPRSSSKSHSEGLAFDMSPMMNSTVALEEENPISGMAWNVASLTVLALAQQGDIPFVVEGDHLHVEPFAKGKLEPGQLFAVWTASPWYSWTQKARKSQVLSALLPSIWLFDVKKLRLMGPSDAQNQQLKDYLSY